MMGTERVSILGLATAFAMEVCVSASSHAADQDKQARCARYAQRAVAQYQLMQSHPQCHVADDLNWHNNLDGHFRGCMLIPEFMSRAGEEGRDTHLQACGGSTSAPTADSGNPTQAVVNPAQPAGPSASGPVTGVSLKPLAPAGPPLTTAACKNLPSAPALGLHPSGFGTGALFRGNALSYTDSATKQVVNYPVFRPMYLARLIGCKNMRGDTGTWMWAAPNGANGSEFEVGLDGSVEASTLNAAQVSQLMR